MPTRLTAAEIADFRSRFPIPPEQVGTYGLIVKDQGRFIDVFKIGDQLAYLQMPTTALPSFADMNEGDVRIQQATYGTVKEVTIADIIAGAIANPVYDPSILQQTVSSISQVIGDTAAAVGTGLAPGFQGLGAGITSLVAGLVSGLWPIALIAAVIGGAYWYVEGKRLLR